MALHGDEFYAQDLSTANLQFVSRFFGKYPEYTERTFLSVIVIIDALLPNSYKLIRTVIQGWHQAVHSGTGFFAGEPKGDYRQHQ